VYLLKKIFKLQKAFNTFILDRERYVGWFYDLCHNQTKVWEDVRVTWLLKYNRAQMHESMEFEDSLPWKWWKKTRNLDGSIGTEDINYQNLKVELVDELHFFISKCLIAGITPNELYDLYKKKLKLNYKRQNEGYLTGEYQKIKNGKEDNEQII